MAKGKTLWEMLTGAASGPVELQYYNPLKAKVGNAVLIDHPDWKDYNFFLKEIREYKRTIGGQQFLFVDYALWARPLHGDEVWVRLRLNPADDGGKTGAPSHQVLLLRLFEDMAYDEGLHNVVRDDTKKFQVLDNGQVTEEFWRINDVSDSYKAQVAVLKDLNSDGTVEADEVRKVGLEYWDYWRETQDQFGAKMTEYLFVEMDTDTGWFQMWKGAEVDPQKVMVM